MRVMSASGRVYFGRGMTTVIVTVRVRVRAYWARITRARRRCVTNAREPPSLPRHARVVAAE